jgi:topoisomerase-4 subunit A
VAIFRKDEDPVYNVIYRDGRDGPVYAKRFKVGGITRDKDYELAQGKPGSRVLWFSMHPDEESSAAQMVIVHLRPALRLRALSRPFRFGEIEIKGRSSRGNLITKHAVDRVVRAPREDGGENGDKQ